MLGAAKEQAVKHAHTQNQGRFNVHGSPECYQNPKERHTIMKRIAIASLLLAMFVTSGCTAVPVNAPPRPSAGQPPEVLAKDSEECDKRARGNGKLVSVTVSMHMGAQMRYMECMEARGYTFKWRAGDL
jgi:hypothetical protein